MKKNIVTFIFSIMAILLSSSNANAKINFDIQKLIWEDKTVYDTKDNIIYSQGYAYDWSKDNDIPTIDDISEPNVMYLYDSYGTRTGYITKIFNCYYMGGKFGDNGTPLPIYPLGNVIPEDLEQSYINNKAYNINLFPYNARNINIKYEIEFFNDNVYGLQHSFGTVGPWVFGWDKFNRKTYILVNGINAIETNLEFKVLSRADEMNTDDIEIMFWEDDTKFYIRNYNIIISTDKESLYVAMKELENTPKVKYQDTYLAFKQPPVIEEDRTLIPIRFLFEQMGATVDWNGETQTATISQNNTAVAFSINDTEADVNGQTVSMDVPARLINDKTMVPVRFLSENLGYTVDWDGEKRIITIK